jgi:hypothetical protein
MIVEALFARRFPAGATGLRGIYAAQRSKNDGREHPFVVCQGLGELASFHHRPGISARERGMDGSHVLKTAHGLIYCEQKEEAGPGQRAAIHRYTEGGWK